MQKTSSTRRPLTDKRQEQNRRSQKRYRERQKRRLNALESLFSCEHGGLPLEAVERTPQRNVQHERRIVSEVPIDLLDSDTINVLEELPSLNGSVTGSSEGAQLFENYLSDDLASASTCLVDVASGLGSADTLPIHPQGNSIPNSRMNHGCLVSPTFPQEGFMAPDSTSSHSHENFVSETVTLEPNLMVRISNKKIPIQDVIKAGLKALSEDGTEALADEPNPYQGGEREIPNEVPDSDVILVFRKESRDITEQLPDLYKNNIRLRMVSFLAAIAANAAMLGISSENMFDEEMVSPFFRGAIPKHLAEASCSQDYKSIKEYLRPCAAQMIHEHHPYLDVLPFPTFRERALSLIGAENPIIDEEELCSDLLNNGVICWGSSLGGGRAGTGSGAPWDVRSWEAQPWFIRKWWFLIGGAEGELYRQTQWWCEMRGDRSCYPW